MRVSFFLKEVKWVMNLSSSSFFTLSDSRLKVATPFAKVACAQMHASLVNHNRMLAHVVITSALQCLPIEMFWRFPHEA